MTQIVESRIVKLYDREPSLAITVRHVIFPDLFAGAPQ